MSDAETTAAQTAAANKAYDLDHQAHDRHDVELLYKIYLEKRLNSQADFYKSRVRENQSNANFTFTFSTAVMSLSAFVATVSAVVSSPIFSLLSAILPALAALLAAFRQLYGWERQISIYQDALMGLERVRLLAPEEDRIALADLSAIYPNIVTGGEQVFTGEVNQWGQFVQNADKNAQEETTDTQVTNALMSDLQLSDEQIATIRKIVAAGTPRPAFSQQTITVHPEETSALPSGGDAAQASQPAQPASVPVSVTTTRTDTTIIHPDDTSTLAGQGGSTVDAQAAPPAAPITVTTTRTESTVVEHVIPAAEAAPPAEETAPAAETQTVSEQEPPPEGSDALTPGSMHVETPQSSEAVDALMSHQDATNEPPPPEAISSLTPGSMHVDAPQAPPENAAPVEDPNANG